MVSRRAPTILLSLALIACGGPAQQNDIDALDEELAATNGDDPLLASALQGPIMSDPDLRSKANADAVRPPAQPYSAPVPALDVAPASDAADGALLHVPAPSGACSQCAVARDALTLGALASSQPNRRTSGCAAALRYSAAWANRLPTDLPLHPQARVIEAAGAEGNGCSLRAVSFAVSRPMATMLDWYYTRATKAGYASEHQTDGARHVLGGTRARGGGAYVVFMTERADGATAIDLLTNGG